MKNFPGKLDDAFSPRAPEMEGEDTPLFDRCRQARDAERSEDHFDRAAAQRRRDGWVPLYRARSMR